MALVTPILLLLILGTFQVGLALVTRLQLVHAAQQGAIAADCTEALAKVPVIYGSAPDEANCSLTSGVLEVRLADAAPIIGPWGPWIIVAVGRAAP